MDDSTGHDDNKTALAPADNSTVAAPADHAVAELERHLGDLAASPQFVPLMGSFRDLLEAERRRNRVRTLLIGAGMVAMLTAFIWGPLHIMQTYIRQSEERMASERASLQRVEHSLDESMTVLADASRDLRKTLEAYRRGVTSTPQAVAEPAVQAVIASPVPAAPVAPLVIVAPQPPLPPAAVVTTAAPAMAAVQIPTVSTDKVAAVATPAAAESNVPAVKPATVMGVPPDVFRAVTSTPSVPVMARVVPAATADTRLDDALADVERTLQSLKRKNATTNTTVRKP